MKEEKTLNKQINPTGNKRGRFFVLAIYASGLFWSLEQKKGI
jgi:hypothetical protein